MKFTPIAAALGGSLGEEIAGAFRDLYSLYPASLTDWFASLYDPEIGGFYFSCPARDTEGFLPDAESTGQALHFLTNSGLTGGKPYEEAIPEEMKRQIVAFLSGLQDPDGYFYHPQWGKDILLSRRGRDLGWCTGALKAFGAPLRYPTLTDIQDGKASAQTLIPEHLSSREKFLAYLESKDIANFSYKAGNEIASQAAQIRACGLGDALIDFLNAHQNENGHWHHTTNYYAVNGIMKISVAYSRLNASMPHPEEAAHAAINAMLSAEDVRAVVDVYNPYVVFSLVLDNLRTCGGEAGNLRADALLAEMRRCAPTAIRCSREKLSAFRTKDNAFVYSLTSNSTHSQGACVAPPTKNMGNVNATCISSTGTVRRLFSALELSSCQPPILDSTDWQHFLDTALRK